MTNDEKQFYRENGYDIPGEPENLDVVYETVEATPKRARGGKPPNMFMFDEAGKIPVVENPHIQEEGTYFLKNRRAGQSYNKFSMGMLEDMLTKLSVPAGNYGTMLMTGTKGAEMFHNAIKEENDR